MTTKKLLLWLFIIFVFGLTIRLLYIDFGLPLTSYADETDISYVVLKNTLNYKTAMATEGIRFFEPYSFVYGSFPAYFLTLALFIVLKFTALIGLGISPTNLVVTLRVINVFVAMLIPILTGFIYYKLFNDKKGFIVTVLLTTLNWKLIVHSYYLNADMFLTVLVTAMFLMTSLYLATERHRVLFSVLTGVFLGLVFGTKVTALISVPLIFAVYAIKKDWKGFALVTVFAFLAYIISNPFSLILFGTFSARLLEMRTKEGGAVFSSVDLSLVKYFYGVAYMLTIPMLAAVVYGIAKVIKPVFLSKPIHFFLLGNGLLYIVFFSIFPRRIDRWLLPILPIMLVYATYGIRQFAAGSPLPKYLRVSVIAISLAIYLYFPVALLAQLSHVKPKVDAFLWAKQNQLLPKESAYQNKILLYTEEGTDPFSLLRGSDVILFEVYESKKAQLATPHDPLLYDYVVISSNTLQNYKNDYVKNTYPDYARNWTNFENLVMHSDKFELLKSFTNKFPNLLGLSDVYVYKRK